MKLAAMPNAFPSLHVGTAMVFVLFAPGRLWRAVSLAFLFGTGFATLSTGEHYVIDLVAGLVFGCFAASVGYGRFRSALLYLGVVLCWSLTVRFAYPFLIAHAGLLRVLVALTVALAVRAVHREWRIPVVRAIQPAGQSEQASAVAEWVQAPLGGAIAWSSSHYIEAGGDKSGGKLEQVSGLSLRGTDGPSGKLEHGVRGETGGEPPGTDCAAHFSDDVLAVQIDQINGKPHEEGVDGFTTPVSAHLWRALTDRSKSGFDLVFSSKRPVVTEAEAGRALVVEVEWLQQGRGWAGFDDPVRTGRTFGVDHSYSWRMPGRTADAGLFRA
jgi:PAP2 superfamily